MIGDPKLVKAADRAAASLVDEILLQTRDRLLPIRGDSSPEWHYPRDLRFMQNARDALLARLEGPPPELRLSAMLDLLRNARAGYPLAQVDRKRGAQDIAHAILAGTYTTTTSDEAWTVLAKIGLDWSTTGRRTQAVFSLEETWFELDDLDPLHVALEDAYLAAERNHRRAKHHSGRDLRVAVWLGGSREQVGVGWDDRLRAAARVRGVDLQIVERPAERRPGELMQHLRGSKPFAAFLWLPYCGNDAIRARILDAAAEVPLVDLIESDLDSVLARLRAALDRFDAELAGEAFAPPRTPVSGEQRFYKKLYSTRNRDVLIPFVSRNDDNWIPAHDNAPKARKGIAHMEGVEPVKLWKCLACTGGGHWMAEY